MELRKRLAAAEGKEKQPFVVASNEVLAAVAAARPRSEQALLKIRGIGKHKLDAYGSAILECISEHAPLSPTSQAAARGGRKGGFAGWKRKRGPTSVDAEDAAIADGRADDESGAAQLSAEQTRALDAVRAGHSIFLTGSAGTGKSFTLRKVIEVLRRMHGKDHVFVTASTGIAASNVGGTTVHSYAGIGLGHAPADELADKVLAKQAVRKRWLLTRALIIDEISMLDGGLFDKLDHVARRVRAARPIMLPSTSSASYSADAPFGGIQLVLCGDFFQLPPVGMERDPTAAGKAVRFMFESHAWRSLGLTSCCLTRSFRQKDPGFIALLDEMRRGSLSPFSISLIHHHAQNPPAGLSGGGGGGGFVPSAEAARDPSGGGAAAAIAPPPTRRLSTRLYAHNDKADAENEHRLAALAASEDGAQLFHWLAHDDGYEQHLNACIAPAALPPCRCASHATEEPRPDESARQWDARCRRRLRARRTGRAHAPREDAPAGQRPDAAEGRLPCGHDRAVRRGVGEQTRPARGLHRRRGRPDDRVAHAAPAEARVGDLHPQEPGPHATHARDRPRVVLRGGEAYVALSRAVSLQTTRILAFHEARCFAHPKVLQFMDSLDVGASDAPTPASAARGHAQVAGAAERGGGLTAEQRALIEEKRAAAIEKRRLSSASACGTASTFSPGLPMGSPPPPPPA